MLTRYSALEEVYGKRRGYASVLERFFSDDELISLFKEMDRRLGNTRIDQFALYFNSLNKDFVKYSSSELVRKVSESNLPAEWMQLGAAAGDVLKNRRYEDLVAIGNPQAKRKAEDYALKLAGCRRPKTFGERLKRFFSGEYPLLKSA